MIFRFRKFSLEHDKSTMKIGTDAMLLSALTPVEDAQSVLDIGCGCGVIAFCLAQQISLKQPDAEIWGIDPDKDSIEEARHNAQHYPLLHSQCFHFLNTTVQSFAQLPIARFDLIVSNPPFFNNGLKPQQPSRQKSKHRDEQLSFEDLIDSVLTLLKPDGRFSIILSQPESIEFDALIRPHLYCYQRIEIQPNESKPVHRVIQQYSYKDTRPCQERRLIIHDSENHYSADYLAVVKPYLLLIDSKFRTA